MSLDSVTATASGALGDISRHLAVVSQNVANAGTAGYAEESVNDTALTAGGAGYGVRTGLTVRAVDVAVQTALAAQDADVAGLQTQQAALSAVGVAQGSTAAGNDLASQVGALADAFTALGADPSNTTQQRAVVSAAATLATGINGQASAYATAAQTAQSGISSGIATLNTALRTVGSLSDQIIAGRNSGESTADLESQRDAQETTATQLGGFRFLPQANGDVLAVAGGLLANTRAATGPFAVAATGTSPAITLSGTDVTAQLTGGSIGADITLRDTTMPAAQAGLDQFAQTLATRLDSQGLRLFSDPSGAVPAGGGVPVQAGVTGFAQVIGVNPAVAADPRLVRDGTQAVAGSATGASAFTPNPAGGPAGFTTLISRVLGYAFGAQAQAGVTQPAVATAGLGAAGTIALSYPAGATLGSFAANLVSAQSQSAADATNALDTAQALQGTLQAKLQSSTGVSVDAELSTMIALQNAYGANAKIITAMQSMWTDLLGTVTP